jgi:hypothetical protein
MKKYVIIGVLLLLLIASGASAFYFLRSTQPAPSDTIDTTAQFGDDAYREAGELPTDEKSESEKTDAGKALLRQVTTRQVAGAVLLIRDGVPYARYAERGTGYMYEVNLSARTEERVSNTTFRQVATVEFSPQGTRAAVSYSGDGGREVAVGTIEKGDDGTSKFVGSVLPKGAQNAGFDRTGEILYYTIENDSGTDGYQRDLKSTITKTIFTLPVRALSALWTPSPLIVTAPSYALFGAAYQTNGERVAYGRGLMAKRSPFGTTTLVNTITTDGVKTNIIDGVTSKIVRTFAFAPKCDFASAELLICGVPQKSLETRKFPDDWLMGSLTTSDTLTSIDLVGNTASELVNPLSAVGQPLDITDMSVVGDIALFVNRIDSTLWTLSI